MRLFVLFKTLVIISALNLFAPLGLADSPVCNSEKHRQFDFWLGKWKVYQANGKLAGENHIEREYNGCVIHERYTTEKGYAGESLNIYDIQRDTWHQTWVDTTGLLLMLDGGMQQSSMVLQGKVKNEKGGWAQHRISWTPNKDGTVRQLWETLEGDGEWKVLFDGLYKKIK